MMKLKSAKGFSIIELLIVIAIMGIVGVIGTSTFSKFRENAQLREAVGAMVVDLNSAKMRAISEHVNYTVTVNTTQNTYRIKGGTYDVTKKISDFGKTIKIYSSLFPSSGIVFQGRGILLVTGTPPSSGYYEVLIRNKINSCIHVRVTTMGSVRRHVHQIK
ncbi:MAG TPA: type II secretion system protein [Smithella sp.]|nr:type II secretion system protein [Smithella sp.]